MKEILQRNLQIHFTTENWIYIY